MSNSLISTLICTYNAEKFISNTLDSVLNQTYTNQEILILDNASQDNTLEILNNYKNRDNRITIISLNKNLGAYGGLNYLLDISKGKYVAIQDHDDIWHKDKLYCQVDFLENNNKYLGCGTSTLMYFSKSKRGYIAREDEHDDFQVMHPSLMFRNNGYRYKIVTGNDYSCDSLFMKNVICNGENLLRNISIPLTLHLIHEDGTNFSSKNGLLVSKNYFKIYFELYGFSLYRIIDSFYGAIIGYLPFGFRQWITFHIGPLRNKFRKIEDLKSNVYCKYMLDYFR